MKINELAEQRAHWYQSEGMALLGPSPTGDREQLFWAYGQRIVALAGGMARLQFPSFSPLVACGTRNALELLVEVLLLRHSPADFRAQERILSWSESARLKAAESGLSHRPSDGLAGAWRECVAAHASDVAQARGRFWNGKHPNRWTGRNLQADCYQADRLLGGEEIGSAYDVWVRQLNWGVHGSGFADVAGLTLQDIDALFCDMHRLAARILVRGFREVVLVLSKGDVEKLEGLTG